MIAIDFFILRCINSDIFKNKPWIIYNLLKYKITEEAEFCTKRCLVSLYFLLSDTTRLTGFQLCDCKLLNCFSSSLICDREYVLVGSQALSLLKR